MEPETNLKIRISGGSIAGCTLAALLSRSNIDVAVYERSQELRERGAGIVMPLSLVKHGGLSRHERPGLEHNGSRIDGPLVGRCDARPNLVCHG